MAGNVEFQSKKVIAFESDEKTNGKRDSERKKANQWRLADILSSSNRMRTFWEAASRVYMLYYIDSDRRWFVAICSCCVCILFPKSKRKTHENSYDRVWPRGAQILALTLGISATRLGRINLVIRLSTRYVIDALRTCKKSIPYSSLDSEQTEWPDGGLGETLSPLGRILSVP
jgi:hypothetical protein